MFFALKLENESPSTISFELCLVIVPTSHGSRLCIEDGNDFVFFYIRINIEMCS
jgi:hypothetical protein